MGVSRRRGSVGTVGLVVVAASLLTANQPPASASAGPGEAVAALRCTSFGRPFPGPRATIETSDSPGHITRRGRAVERVVRRDWKVGLDFSPVSTEVLGIEVVGLSGLSVRLFAAGRAVAPVAVTGAGWHGGLESSGQVVALTHMSTKTLALGDVVATTATAEVRRARPGELVVDVRFYARLRGPDGAPALVPVDCGTAGYGIAHWLWLEPQYPRWDLVVPPPGAPAALAAVPIVAMPSYA